MDKTELEQLRPKIAAYMEGAVKEGEMLFFLLTNILTESSDLVFAGERRKGTGRNRIWRASGELGACTRSGFQKETVCSQCSACAAAVRDSYEEL